VTDFKKNISIELNQTDEHIKLIIDDTGMGFNNLDTDIKNILNPYFTTKKKGTGLGLSIVNKIINDHNGNIEFVSKNEGAKIKIIFLK
jgi:two-component system nitrogen regulation sensor histidine kinase NtrY